ncbi:dithiol-disulfide isomerase [Lactobacillus equicursoris]|uniref:Dithiol-disulfide isomerase n=1 Tax=Lactobacillus equicursoris TaxID=420645 RepID=A0A844FKV1_9LACO|nr:DsbA family protein [Lactobacillus equicursoris]MST79171.1 dithiol-disulfide isomerase [Lactobacillus equicursoris]
MFELFLFINPLGLSCFQLENKIKLLAEELDLEICVNYLPLVTLDSMKADMVKRNWNFNTVINLAHYHEASLSAQNLYYAIQIAYGKKRARKFLFNLQEKLSCGKEEYSFDLAKKLISDLKLDLKKIEGVKQDDCLKNAIGQDQQLAKKFHINSLPSAVIFDDAVDDSGLLLDGEPSLDELRSIFASGDRQAISDSSEGIACEPVCDYNSFYCQTGHLHLL